MTDHEHHLYVQWLQMPGAQLFKKQLESDIMSKALEKVADMSKPDQLAFRLIHKEAVIETYEKIIFLIEKHNKSEE